MDRAQQTGFNKPASDSDARSSLETAILFDDIHPPK